MRLSTQVALLSTLLAVFAVAVSCIIAITFFEVSPLIWLVAIPIGFLCFFLSLIIAHFVTSPLRDLVTLAKKYKAGDKTVIFTQPSSVTEIQELGGELEEFTELAEARGNELTTLKQRQDEFVSDVAHEFRTPLTAISGNAELMLDEDMPQSTREHFCEIILSETERLKKLTNDLLSLQHIRHENQTYQLARINCKEVAESVVEFLSPIAQERNISLTVEGESPDILSNENRLKQALINLIDNAIRHVNEGGHVRVILSGVEGQSVIAVKDDGCGLGDADPELLFKRFYRADSSRARNTGGSGLGLAIVKEIVEANDGSVTAYNAPDGGAVFLMAFPAIAS